jgi:hypothetical protein
MLKVWAGLEARSFLQASAEAVSVFILTPKEIRSLCSRWNAVSKLISCHRISNVRATPFFAYSFMKRVPFQYPINPSKVPTS